jgi:membrane associated rhomboid family serine protease
VIALIVINVVAYLWESNHGLTNAFEAKYFIVPELVHSELYTLITSAFLHLNTTHILLNMITLAIIGSPVEAEIGPVRFSMLYLLAAVGGSVGFYLLAPANEAGAGASGAIFGLMGAYFVLGRLRGWELRTIVALLVINALYSLSPGIAWQDHLGGFVAGCVACFAMMWRPPRSRPVSEVTEAVQALAASLALLVVMGLLLQIPPGHVNL